MKIDHITVAARDLKTMQSALDKVGISSEYGGLHSNGVTRMSFVAFQDGSYLELVSTVTPGAQVPLWSDHQLPASGGSAWTVEVSDVAAEVTRARGVGIGGRDPIEVRRQRPDGVVGRWELGYLCRQSNHGDQPGGVLPFLIHDFTPREVRVKPSGAMSKYFEGWSNVGLAVCDLESSVELFKTIYTWPAPEVGLTASGDRIAMFGNTPVTLLSPQDEGPLATHLRLYGESPYAAIIRTGDAALVQRRFRLGESDRWLRTDIHWLDLPWNGVKIGLEW